MPSQSSLDCIAISPASDAGASTHNLVWCADHKGSTSPMTLPLGFYPLPSSKSSGSSAKRRSLEDVYNSPEASPALAAQHEARRPLDPAMDAEAATQLQRRLCASPLAAAPSAVNVSDSDTDDDEPLISCIKPGHVTLVSSAHSPAGSSATSSGGDVEVLAEWETPPSASLPAGAVVTSPESCSAAAGRNSLPQDSDPPQVCNLISCAFPSTNDTCLTDKEPMPHAGHAWSQVSVQAPSTLLNGVHPVLGQFRYTCNLSVLVAVVKP